MSETSYCFPRLATVGRVHRFSLFSEEFGLTQPFKGLNINGSLHMTIQTGVFIETLQAFGTTVRWASYNILSAQDHAAAGITKAGTATVFAWKGDWVTSLRSFFPFRQTGVISKIVKLSLG